jgi:hypothetical protein
MVDGHRIHTSANPYNSPESEPRGRWGSRGTPSEHRAGDLERRRFMSIKSVSRSMAGVCSSLLGLAMIVLSAPYLGFGRATTDSDLSFGALMWLAGSALLGGGVALPFTTLKRALVAALLSPGLITFFVVALFWGLIIMSAH